MKKLLIIPIFLFLSFGNLAFGQPNLSAPKALEVNYPSIQNSPTLTENTNLPEYVKYIFDIAIAASGLIALVVFTLAGVKYLTSTGSPGAIQDSKERMWSAFFGLFILFTSYILLNTINPNFLKFEMPKGLPGAPPNLASGVYICGVGNSSIKEFWAARKDAEKQDKVDADTVARMEANLEDINQNCKLMSSEGDIPENYDGNTVTVWLVPNSRDKIQYGVIVYSERGRTGNGKVFFGTGGENANAYAMDEPVALSSEANGLSIGHIRPFILNHKPSPTWYAKIFKELEFNERVRQQGQNSGQMEANCAITQASNSCQTLKEIRSIRINGEAFAIFKNGQGWSMSDQVDIVESDTGNLYNRLMDHWNKEKCKKDVGQKEPDYFPCADQLIVIAGSFL